MFSFPQASHKLETKQSYMTLLFSLKCFDQRLITIVGFLIITFPTTRCRHHLILAKQSERLVVTHGQSLLFVYL